MVARSIAAAMLAATIVTVSARDADAHPLHTTLTEITVDAAHHTLRATVRLFADDLTAALVQHPSLPGSDLKDRATAYVIGNLILSSGGRSIAMQSCGVRHSGDLLWVCLETRISGEPVQLRARNPLLLEAFRDQVNIIQIGDGPTRRSVLFLKGDGDKPL